MIVDTEGANSKNVLDVGLLCEIPMPKWNGVLFSSTSSMCSTLIKMHWPLSMEFSVHAQAKGTGDLREMLQSVSLMLFSHLWNFKAAPLTLSLKNKCKNYKITCDEVNLTII